MWMRNAGNCSATDQTIVSRNLAGFPRRLKHQQQQQLPGHLYPAAFLSLPLPHFLSRPHFYLFLTNLSWIIDSRLQLDSSSFSLPPHFLEHICAQAFYPHLANLLVDFEGPLEYVF